jgi:hypothetical protein
MNRTVIATAIAIILLVAGLAYFNVGIFADTPSSESSVSTTTTPTASAETLTTELDAIDLGADLEADFSESDTSIQQL